MVVDSLHLFIFRCIFKVIWGGERVRAIRYKGKLYTELSGANSIEGEIEDVDKLVEWHSQDTHAAMEWKRELEAKLGKAVAVLRCANDVITRLSDAEWYDEETEDYLEIVENTIASLEPKEGA